MKKECDMVSLVRVKAILEAAGLVLLQRDEQGNPLRNGLVVLPKRGSKTWLVVYYQALTEPALSFSEQDKLREQIEVLLTNRPDLEVKRDALGVLVRERCTRATLRTSVELEERQSTPVRTDSFSPILSLVGAWLPIQVHPFPDGYGVLRIAKEFYPVRLDETKPAIRAWNGVVLGQERYEADRDGKVFQVFHDADGKRFSCPTVETARRWLEGWVLIQNAHDSPDRLSGGEQADGLSRPLGLFDLLNEVIDAELAELRLALAYAQATHGTADESRRAEARLCEQGEIVTILKGHYVRSLVWAGPGELALHERQQPGPIHPAEEEVATERAVPSCGEQISPAMKRNEG
jgi:hypothetical protein